MKKNAPIIIERSGNGFQVSDHYANGDKAVCSTKKALLSFIDRHFSQARGKQVEDQAGASGWNGDAGSEK